MADDTKRTYTEDEHTAILADRVARETAEVTADRDRLKGELSEAQTKLDAADSAKIAAETAQKAAEEKAAQMETDAKEREAAAERETARVAVIKAKAPHLDDDWFAVEGRMARIVAMEDDAFTGYVDDLVAAIPAGDGTTTREVPRETAMKGEQPGGASKRSAGREFILRGYEAPAEPAQKGA